MKYGIHQKNLKRLLDLLEGRSHPGLNLTLDLRLYSEDCREDRPNCGSVGCLIGWFSWIEHKFVEEGFYEFSVRSLVSDTENGTWRFLFDASWHGPEQKEQAALRIRYILKHKQPPPGWAEDEEQYQVRLKQTNKGIEIYKYCFGIKETDD